MPVRLTVARTIRPCSTRSAIVAITNAATIVTAALNQSACQSDSAMGGSGTLMGAHSTRQAVLLDALGTLISFEPPAPRLRLAPRAPPRGRRPPAAPPAGGRPGAAHSPVG